VNSSWILIFNMIYIENKLRAKVSERLSNRLVNIFNFMRTKEPHSNYTKKLDPDEISYFSHILY